MFEKLHWLRVLKRCGVSTTPLKKIYLCMIRPILTYAAEAWYGYLSATQKEILERIQRISCKYMLPELSYDASLKELCLPTIEDYIVLQTNKLFAKIQNIDHPLHDRLPKRRMEISHRNTRSALKSAGHKSGNFLD